MKLNLTDTILLSLMLAILMIGGHQMYLVAKTEGLQMGFLKSYWIFMFLMVLIVIYQIRKTKRENSKPNSAEKANAVKSRKVVSKVNKRKR